MKTSFRKHLLATALATITASALLACGGGGGGGLLTVPPSGGTTGQVRVVDAISDATSLNVHAAALTSDIGSVPVNGASTFRTAPTTAFDLAVTLNTSSGSQPTFTYSGVSVDAGSDTTVYLPGRITEGSYSGAGFQIKNPNAAIGTGDLEVTPVHAASLGPANITLYITQPSGTLTSGIQINLAYRGSGAPTQIIGGTYRLRVTAAGSSTVIFDSGISGVALNNGARLQLAALNETDTSRNSAIVILSLPSDGSSSLLIHNSTTTTNN